MRVLRRGALHRLDPHLRFFRLRANPHRLENLSARAVATIAGNCVLCPAPTDFATISGRLVGVRVGEILVGFHLGTGRTALRGWQWFYRNRAKDPRIWPVARYTAVARRVREINQTSLLELAALMRHLRVFVTNDNGALHVASAVDTPVVGLFGPTFPERTGMFPPQSYHFAIRRPAIEEIDSEEVCAAVVRLLAFQAARPGWGS